MNKPVIQVENLGKAYRIGLKEEIPDTLMGAVKGFARYPFKNLNRLRRLDTFSENGEAEADDILWALKDVSFEVQEGEVVGIIGRNGAGKSTLLKILSRITEPTHGRAVIRGRVSSLLEVGTGFHPELTGRENIYMNGTILGMTKREIDRKFDEIVNFSGVEKFLDTPTKRYSSGMQVRLAFAVAAHLEPEILIIDEVLAVGDAEFQKRCLGKMQDVARGGRTVLFVSHNMTAVQSLCTRSLLLSAGAVCIDADTSRVLQHYLSAKDGLSNYADFTQSHIERQGSGAAYFQSAHVSTLCGKVASSIPMGNGISVRMRIAAREPVRNVALGIGLFTDFGIRLCGVNSAHTSNWTVSLDRGESQEFECQIRNVNLAPGRYAMNLLIKGTLGDVLYDSIDTALTFEVIDSDIYGTGHVAAGNNLIFLTPEWTALGVTPSSPCHRNLTV